MLPLRHNGKVLFAGSGLSPSTFLHYLEDLYDLPYLAKALCQYRKEDGSVDKVLINKHLPGHRDFYRKDAENSKFYQRAFAAGLKINKADVGLSDMQVINLKQLFEIGSQIIKADPNVLLCDDPNCLYCSSNKQ